LVVALVGCAAPGPTALTHSVRSVRPDERATLWTSAQAALMAEGFTLDRVDQNDGIITARPMEVSAHQEIARGPARLGRQNPIRRVAEVRLSPTADGLGVYCRVSIQEQATEAYRLLAAGAAGSDVPDQTAIERGAGATPEQDSVWQTVRRDKMAEQRILEAILGRGVSAPAGP
jgi:hypothetical protein